MSPSSSGSAATDQHGPGSAWEKDKQEREAREAERRVKRFQLLTKTEDPVVGRVYLALAQEGSGIGSSSDREIGMLGRRDDVVDKEGEYERSAFYNPPEIKIAVETEKKSERARGRGGNEQDALDAFYSDEEWEARVGGPSRAPRIAESVQGQWLGGGKTTTKGQGGRWAITPSTGPRAQAFQKA